MSTKGNYHGTPNWQNTGERMKEASLKASKAIDELSVTLNKFSKPKPNKSKYHR